jgi:hypothetical protein
LGKRVSGDLYGQTEVDGKMKEILVVILLEPRDTRSGLSCSTVRYQLAVYM